MRPGGARDGSDPEVAFHAGAGCPRELDLPALAASFGALLAHFPRRVARVDALVVGDAAMDEAHRRHSGVAGTTDVLSFPAHDEGDPSAPVEVDLIVCADFAAREAAARAHSREEELLLYAVHGTLHACGMRDDTPESHAAIHAEEDRILEAAGRRAVYRRPERRGNPGTDDPKDGGSSHAR
jgi:probable rRNA maturation factor